MTEQPVLDPVYRRLAERLDRLPEGFPPTQSGVELRLLAHLFTPEEAALVADLTLEPETAPELAQRTGRDGRQVRQMLKDLVRRGLISAERTPRGLGYALLPFVVGIYEMQGSRIDRTLAELFEAYYHEAFGRIAAVYPPVHRVIPVQKSLQTELNVQPYENAAEIVRAAQAWGVLDCVCRKQKALIGQPCGHPLDVCMILSQTPGAFDQAEGIRALTLEEALATLQRAAEAGLVHSVSNSREDLWYICNCCTCSCGILRGMVDLGLSGVVASSGFVSQVDEEACIACGVCADTCPFTAITVEDVARIDALRCAGCGLCVPACPTSALSLVRRPDAGPDTLPADLAEWRQRRAQARGLDLSAVEPDAGA